VLNMRGQEVQFGKGHIARNHEVLKFLRSSLVLVVPVARSAVIALFFSRLRSQEKQH
jgi:hypothetical protein